MVGLRVFCCKTQQLKILLSQLSAIDKHDVKEHRCPDLPAQNNPALPKNLDHRDQHPEIWTQILGFSGTWMK
jgi:hypothetical protein